MTLHTVPDGMPFLQQVKTVEDAQARKAFATQQVDSERTRLRRCAEIDSELKTLQLKYTSWAYVPVNEVNIDQGRERDLKARRSQIQCHSQ